MFLIFKTLLLIISSKINIYKIENTIHTFLRFSFFEKRFFTFLKTPKIIKKLVLLKNEKTSKKFSYGKLTFLF